MDALNSMVQLFWSPTRFFEARRRRSPAWGLALAAPIACAALQGVAALLFSAKVRPVMEGILADQGPRLAPPPRLLMAFITALGYPMFLGVLVLSMLALNVLVRRPGSPKRLTEFTALGFYTQIPAGLLLIAIAWLWQPDPTTFAVPVSSAELVVIISRYGDILLSEPLPSTGRLVSLYSLIWLASTLTCALKAEVRLSRGGTTVAALTLLTICAGGPLVGMLLELTP